MIKVDKVTNPHKKVDRRGKSRQNETKKKTKKLAYAVTERNIFNVKKISVREISRHACVQKASEKNLAFLAFLPVE